jgi:hypothetical protein
MSMADRTLETASESGRQVEVSHAEFCAGLPAGRFRTGCSSSVLRCPPSVLARP